MNTRTLVMLISHKFYVLINPCQVTDAMLMNASFVYPENTPTTKEAYYYRAIFEKFFPKVSFVFSLIVVGMLVGLSLSLTEHAGLEL